MKHTKLSFFTVLSFVILVLSSCGNSANKDLETYLGSYVESNENTVFFGTVDIMSILEKAEYKQIPKFGLVASSYIKEVSRGFDLEKGVFYAINGPLKTKAEPTDVVLFLQVKNADTLKALVMQQGFDVEDTKDFSYFRDNDVSMAFKGNLAAMLIKNGDFDEAKMFEEIFEKSSHDVESDLLEDLTEMKGDIQLVAHMEHLYSTSNTDLNALSPEKKNQIKELTKDGFVTAALFFEAGQMRLTSKNYFSEALKKRMVFKKDNTAKIRTKLGEGEPTVAFAMNMDVRLMQAFVDDFSPKKMDELVADMGGPFQLLMMVSGGKVSNLLNGELGMAMYGESSPMVGVTPDFNFYAGFGPQGNSLAEMAKEYMQESEFELKISKEGVMGASSIRFQGKPGSVIRVPEGCEQFGKGGLTGYLNFSKMDMKSFELEGAAKMLYLAKYATIYFDNDGGEIILKAKEGSSNILKQASQFLIEEFSSQIGGMAI